MNRNPLNKVSLDTDNLVVRRVFAFDSNNGPLSNNHVLAVSNSEARWVDAVRNLETYPGVGYLPDVFSNIEQKRIDLSNFFARDLSGKAGQLGFLQASAFNDFSNYVSTDISALSLHLDLSLNDYNVRLNNVIGGSVFVSDLCNLDSNITSKIVGLSNSTPNLITFNTLSSNVADVSNNLTRLSNYTISNINLINASKVSCNDFNTMLNSFKDVSGSVGEVRVYAYGTRLYAASNLSLMSNNINTFESNVNRVIYDLSGRIINESGVTFTQFNALTNNVNINNAAFNSRLLPLEAMSNNMGTITYGSDAIIFNKNIGANINGVNVTLASLKSDITTAAGGGISSNVASNIASNVVSTATSNLSNRILTYKVHIGTDAGEFSQNMNTTAVGGEAGYSNQQANATAVGIGAGAFTQGQYAVALGREAGKNTQNNYGIAVGYLAGYDTQKTEAIAIGREAGRINQEQNCIAIGSYAQSNLSSHDSIAIGTYAGNYNQDSNSIAIGYYAAQNDQGWQSIAIGDSAGKEHQGNYSIAIGYKAGVTSQPDNSIVLNATGMEYESSALRNSFCVRPMNTGAYDKILYYQPNSGEITYADAPTNSLTADLVSNYSSNVVCNYIGILSNNDSNIAIGKNFLTLCNITTTGGNIISANDVTAYSGTFSLSNVFQMASNASNVANKTKSNFYTSNSSVIISSDGTAITASNANSLYIKKMRDASANKILYYDPSSCEITFSTAPSGGSGTGLPAATSESSYVYYSVADSQWKVGSNTIRIGYNSGVTSQTIGAIAIGFNAGNTSQSLYSVAVGGSAGASNQDVFSVAIGYEAGKSSQLQNAVALGPSAGSSNQGAYSIAIGDSAGLTLQGMAAVAIGASAGETSQKTGGIAIGIQAGQTSQGINSIAIGSNAGNINQLINAIAIGINAGTTSQRDSSVAIGNSAGQINQQSYAIAIGSNAGYNNQQINSVAIGINAGTTSQQNNSVAVGNSAGQSNQKSNSVAVGITAGQTTQGISAVAVGDAAGQTSQGNCCVAIGNNAGQMSQEAFAVAVGVSAGTTSQGTYSVAVGANAGQSNNGDYSIAIGCWASKSNPNSTYGTIVLNANTNAGGSTPIELIPQQSSAFYVAPIRSNAPTSNDLPLFYNNTSKEITQAFQSPIIMFGMQINLQTLTTINNGTENLTYSNWGAVFICGINYDVTGGGAGNGTRILTRVEDGIWKAYYDIVPDNTETTTKINIIAIRRGFASVINSSNLLNIGSTLGSNFTGL
jgi:hypothetical protein